MHVFNELPILVLSAALRFQLATNDQKLLIFSLRLDFVQWGLIPWMHHS